MDYSQLSPQEVARECLRTGLAEAWDKLIEITKSLVAATAWRVSSRWGEKSKEAREDLVQDFYLKLCDEDKTLLKGLAAGNRLSKGDCPRVARPRFRRDDGGGNEDI